MIPTVVGNGLTPAGHQGVKSINALRRGMEVLQAIEDTSAATFAELHQQTGLPKASLLRILKTLRECGRISYSHAQRRYMPSTHGGSTDEARDHWQDRLISIAAPACQALQRRVPWPVDLAIRDGQAMLILDALRAPTGFAVNYRALGFRPPMLLSSLGRCYLAFCPAAEREDLLKKLARSTHQADIQARRPERIKRLLGHASALGYAARDASLTEADSADRFGAISVPVRHGEAVAACIGISWLPAVASEPQIVQAHLKALRNAAAALELQLGRAGLPARGPLAAR